MTKISAAGHLQRLRRHVEAIEVAEGEEKAAAKVHGETTKARKETEERLHLLIRQPHEVLEETEIDSDTGEPLNPKTHLAKIKETEALLVKHLDSEKLAKGGKTRATAHTKRLVEHLRALIHDPGAELPFEEAETGEDGDEDDSGDDEPRDATDELLVEPTAAAIRRGEAEILPRLRAGEPVKALSIWNPWAALVELGAKTIETRSWKTEYRGLVAIHASKPKDPVRLSLPMRQVLEPRGFHRGDLAEGSVVAVTELLDVRKIDPGLEAREWLEIRTMLDQACRELGRPAIPELEMEFGDYTPGRYAWILSGVVFMVQPPQAERGRQRLWDWRYKPLEARREEAALT